MRDRVIAVRTDLRLVDESPDWLVVEKPAPLIIHPTSAKKEPTLLDELNALLVRRGEQDGTLSIINRLDRETSGLVLVARNPEAARAFGKAMQRREIGKQYLALVWGWPEWDEEVVDAPILRRGEVEDSPVWLKQTVHPDGRRCVTRLAVADRFQNEAGRFALVRVVPETGRMHQIRVHLSHAGFPIVGDKLYGPDENCYLEFIETGWTEELRRQLLLDRQALHSARLAVQWDGRPHAWESPLPPELAAFPELGH